MMGPQAAALLLASALPSQQPAEFLRLAAQIEVPQVQAVQVLIPQTEVIATPPPPAQAAPAISPLPPLPVLLPVPIPRPAPAQDHEVETVAARTNFSYGDIESRLERFVAGRPKKSRKKTRRKASRAPGSSGARPDDRVEDHEIRYIVIHSALGSYEGTIAYLLRKPVAAHFMVGKEGDVARMVDIKDFANHVRNAEVEKASVGIETETGSPQPPYFSLEDWDPQTRWRMYASLARLIRAICNETGVPRDTEHILGHGEVDRGIPGAHTDPGDLFYQASYPVWEERFPGQGVTPQGFLMRLIQDDVPPVLERSAAGRTEPVHVKDAERLGLSRIQLARAGGAAPETMFSWEAPALGLPAFQADVPLPAQPGSYSLEASDLVGNTTRALFLVE